MISMAQLFTKDQKNGFIYHIASYSNTMLQPVVSPTRPLGRRYICCIPTYITWSTSLLPTDGDGRKVGEFEETRSWSFEAHVFMEFMVVWRSFMAGD